MAGNREGFQLLEFQPKTVYLPEHPNGTTGTFRRPGSAEERGDPREVEYARIRRSYNEYDGTGPRERIIPLHDTHPVDGMKQPLLMNNNDNAPVYLLVPADSANLAASQGRYVGGQDPFYGGNGVGAGMMDGHGIRRKPTYIRERDDIDSYRREKSCCSCWKCMIALIVILTIIGLGLAITGIVFIKLIHQDSQPAAVNGTDTRSIPSQRSAMTDGSPSFDLDSNSTQVRTDVNGTGNATNYDVLVSGLGGANAGSSADTTTQPTDMSGISVVEVPLSGNVSHVSITLEQSSPEDPADATVNPLVAQVYGVYNEEAYGQDPDALHPLVARVYDQGNAAFGDDPELLETTTTRVTPAVTVHMAGMAVAFHHPTLSPNLVPSINNQTRAIVQDATGNAQRQLEEAQRIGFREVDHLKIDVLTSSGNASTVIPLPSP